LTKRAIFIAGPTASGKSRLALDLADGLAAHGGTVIVNADSMQVYRELRVMTARPSVADEARVPHRLYGVMPAAEACSAMRWRDLAAVEIDRAWAEGRLPIVVGGTGLYFRALLDGLAPVPPIPSDVRRAARGLHAQLGPAAFHARLGQRDPVMAARLETGDSQRLVRAWEVIEATGVSLAEWQRRSPADAGFSAPHLRFVLEVPRAELVARIEERLASMIDGGALAEVRALGALGLDARLPAMKAAGVPELLKHLDGGCTLDEALGKAAAATRRLAKRQATWYRHQAADWTAVAGRSAQYSESLEEKIFPIIRRFLLTESG
jgi:tRNA dimethylallyltransferase